MYLVAIGDSKTVGFGCCAATGGYQPTIISNLNAALPTKDYQWLGVDAVGGVTTHTVASGIDAFLATLNNQDKLPEWVLINLGSNDLQGADNGSLTKAAWTADLAYILDAVHAKWPAVMVGVMRPYWLGYNTGMTRMDDTWIPEVVASRSAWAIVGPDERVFLEEGVTVDVTHPNAAGYVLTAAAWQTAMGY